MPGAIERSFTADYPPTRLYVDSDVLIAFFNAGEPHHDRAVRFFERLAEIGVTTLYLSSLTWLEYAHVVSKGDFREGLPQEVKDRFRLRDWADAIVRSTYLSWAVSFLDALLSQFDRVEIELTPELRTKSIERMAEFNLRAQDALHLASAISVGVLDLASFDRSFRRVSGLYLWNDRIHLTPDS